jgi:hypothetical protein
MQEFAITLAFYPISQKNPKEETEIELIVSSRQDSLPISEPFTVKVKRISD